MQLRYVAIGIIVTLGVGLLGYGLVEGNEVDYSIDVRNAGNHSDLQSDISVKEYDYLDPDMQDAFRKSLQTRESVRVPGSPGTMTIYVHYRDSYYQLFTVHGDGAFGTAFFSMTSGLGFIVLGTLGWYFARRRSRRSES